MIILLFVKMDFLNFVITSLAEYLQLLSSFSIQNILGWCDATDADSNGLETKEKPLAGT